jgi:hypothetical protein
VTDLDQLKAETKKLSSQAVNAKMDLHDLAEDLPLNWQQILEVAQRAYDVHKELELKRALLKTTGE